MRARSVLPAILFAALSAPLALPATAAAPRHKVEHAAASPAPKELGKFDAWIAATHAAGGQAMCYAFTRAGSDDPATGTGPILSVTDRSTGRDEVAISGGPLFPKGKDVTVSVGSIDLDFYTSGHDAFARDNKAAVAAFQRGATATLALPAEKGRKPATLSFSLKGFSAAHDAVRKACPPH